MVLAKLLAVLRPSKLQPKQLLALADLDAILDVTTDAFDATVATWAAAFRRARATLDLAGYRAAWQSSANMAELPEMPDVREAFYQQDLRRIAAMDRAEEFRMARRHEFLAAILRDGFTRSGMAKAAIDELLKQPARNVRSAAASMRPVRGLDATWFQAMVAQFDELRQLYVEGALYIVLTTVNRYRGLGVDTGDLIQEGNASLFQAIDGFDWRRDVRFRTYAQFWVHQAVLKMLYNSSRTVRVPIWVQKVLGKIRRVQEEGRRSGCSFTSAEIAAKIGVPTSKVDWVLSTRRYAVSLDAELPGEDGGSLASRLPDESAVPVPESVPLGDLGKALAGVMADLPEREQRILRRRFGLDGVEPQTLGEIAVEFGISAERVRQLQNAAISRIKRPAKLRHLQAFVE
ncbi:MAG: sigma-70 family RNA polymerase sigma factor [Planctomycetes bacterium]|nr:sigma-70 family RNA polymerase sigma factor [Planctomycetota bacterium]